MEISGPYFPAIGLNTERYFVSFRIQSKFGKIQTRITPNRDNFYAVIYFFLSLPFLAIQKNLPQFKLNFFWWVYCQASNLFGIYLFKTINKHTSKRREIYLKLIIETPDHLLSASFWCIYQLRTFFRFCSCVFIVDFEQINANSMVVCLSMHYQWLRPEIKRKHFSLDWIM